MRTGRKWAVAEPIGQPAFVTAFTDPDGLVGTRFFEQWSAANGWELGDAAETPGLFDSLDALRSDHFRPEDVHPLVRQLYEKTTTVEFLALKPAWKPLGWMIHSVYYQLVARWMQQLEAPLHLETFPTDIHSEVRPLRPSPGAPLKYRAWVRTYKTTGRIFYTAGVFHYGVEGTRGSQRYLVAALPLWRLILTVVFQPANLPNGGFSIDTRHPGTYEGGTHLILPGRRRFCMTPAFGVRDQILLSPRKDETGEYLEGIHNTWVGPLAAYTIPYRIRPYQQGNIAASPAAPSKKPDPTTHPANLSQLPAEVPVVVVGSGPAGLAAAGALRKAGLDVLLVESSSQLGGKCYSFRDSAGHAHGHGVHAWWPGYVNFDELLVDAGVDPADALRAAQLGGVVVEPGRMADIRDPDVLWPSPLHLPAMMRRIPGLRLGDFLGMARFAVHALAFDHVRDYARYDSLTFAQLAERSGVSSRVKRFFLAPFTLSFDYAPPETVSASSILSALQFYLFPSPTSVRPRWSRGLDLERIFQPLAERFTGQRGRLAHGFTLESVKIENGNVVGVELSGPPARGADGEAIGEREIAVVAMHDVPTDGYASFPSRSGPLWIGRANGDLHVFTQVCPHAGFAVYWRQTGFVCPTHGSVFHPDGARQDGPTGRGLDSPRFEERDGNLHVFGPVSRRTLACSHVVLATSVVSATAVVERSEGVPEALRTALRALRTTPVIVVRLWLKSGTPFPVERESIVLPDGIFADVCFCLNALGQARQDDGVVLEFHCAASGAKRLWTDATDDGVLDAVFTDLATIEPRVARSDLLSGRGPEIQRHGDTFTLYSPGEAGRRPGAESGVSGLHLAGDWTRADWSVWMMERAVVSGLRAANRVLGAAGLAMVPIRKPPRDGTLMRLVRTLARAVRPLVRIDLDGR